MVIRITENQVKILTEEVNMAGLVQLIESTDPNNIHLAFQIAKSQGSRFEANFMKWIEIEYGDLMRLFHFKGVNSLEEKIIHMFNETNLRYTNQGLSKIPEDIDKLINLEILNMSDNSLKGLPESLGSLPRLKTLKISGNKIQTLPSNMKNNKNLQYLYLNNNSFNSLPRWVASLPLHYIDISGNPISKETVNKIKAALPHTYIKDELSEN